METTRNYQENKVQLQNQQELFDLETKRKIKDSLQEIYNKQQQRQQQAINGSYRIGCSVQSISRASHMSTL